MTVRLPGILLILLSLLTSTQALSIISTAPPINSINPLNHSAFSIGHRPLNLTLPDPPISFSVTCDINGPKLNTTATFVNVVDALKTLALGDWEGRILDGTEYRSSDAPQVSISISTAIRRRNLQARYVIWAIFYGVLQMISRNKFEFAQFELKLDGTLLGWVHVVDNPLPPPRLTINGGEDPDRSNRTVDVAKRLLSQPTPNIQPSLSKPNITTTIETSETIDPAETRLNTTFTPYGSPLSILDVLLPVMNALTDIAEFPSHHRAQGLVAAFGDYQGAVCILPALPFQAEPPFLTYEFLIRALARIPKWMLETRYFGELNVLVEVDQIRVGFGKVSTVPGCRRGVE